MADSLPFLSLAQEIADHYVPPQVTAPPSPPPPKLGFFGNLARGAKVGAMVDVPTMVGQALEAPGHPGDTLYDIGKGLVDSAKARGMQPGYESDPDSLVQAGARTLPTILGLTAAGAAAAAAAPEAIAAGVGTLATGALGAGLFGGSQFQETFDKAKAAGATDDEAHAAARNAGLISGAVGAAGPAVAGRFIRGVGAPIASRLFGARTAESVAGEFTNPRLLKPLLLGTAEQAVAQPALMAGQAAGIAAVERGAGIQGPTPAEAAESSVLPTLSMVALSTPFAAMGLGMSNRARTNIADAAASPTVPRPTRTRAVLAIGAEMTKVDPNVGAEWQLSALEAISNDQPVEIHPDFSATWKTTQEQMRAAAALKESAQTPLLLEKPAIPLSTGMVPNEEERMASAAADAHADAVYSAREEYEKQQKALRPTNVPPEEAPTGEPPPVQTVAERAGVQDLTPGGVAPTTDTAMGHAFRAAQLDAAFRQRESELAAKKESEMLSLQIAGQFTRQAERNVAAGEKLATAAEERPGLTTINTPADPDIAVSTMKRLVDEAGIGKIQPGVYRQVTEALQQKSRQAQMTALDELPSHKNEKTKSYAAIDLLLKYMRGEDETARATEAPVTGEATKSVEAVKPVAGEAANAEPARAEPEPATSEAPAATAEVARTRPEGNGPAFRAAGEGEEGSRTLGETFGEEDELGPEAFSSVSDKFAGDEGDAALSAQLPNKPSLFYHEDHPFRRDLPINDPENRQFLLHYAEARWFLGNAEGVPEIKRLAEAMNFIPPEHITERIRNAALESFRGWTPEDHARFTNLLATYVRSVELAGRMGDVAAAKEKAAKQQLNYQLKQEREEAAAARAAAAVNLAKGMRRGIYGLQSDLEFMGHIANNGGNANAALQFIANRHSDSTVRSIARALYNLNLGTTIERSADDSLIGAVFIPEENRALIGRGGDNGVTVMHELVHAATHAGLERGLINIAALESGSKTEADLSLRELAEVDATRVIQRLFDDYRKGIFLKDTPAALAASNLHDFVAESLSNPDIQEILGARGWGMRLWGRFVDFIHRMLGRPQIGDTPFEQLLQVVPTLFGKPNVMSRGVFFSPLKRSLDGYLMGTAKGVFGPDSYGWFARTTMLHQQEVLRSRIAELGQKYPELAKPMAEVLKGFNGYYERIRDRAGYHTALTSEFKSLGQDRLTLQNTNLKAFEKLTGMMVESSRVGIDPRKSFQDVVDAATKRKGEALTTTEVANLRRVHDTPYANKLRADFQDLKRVSAEMEARAHGKPIVTPMSLYEKEIVNSQALHMRPMANYVSSLIRSFASNDPRFTNIMKRLDTWDTLKQATDQRQTLAQQVGALGQAIRDADALVTQHREAVLGQVVKRFGKPQKEVRGEKIDVVNPNADDYINFLKGQKNTDELQKAVRAADNLRQSITDLHSRYAGQLDVPYFHLGRTGEYMIHFRVADDAENSTANWDRVMAVVGGDLARGGLGQGVGPPLRGNRDVYIRFRDEEQHAEAEKRLTPLRAAGLMKKANGETSWASGKMDMKEWGTDTATPLFIHKLKESVDSLTSLSAEQREDMKDAIQQQYLASLPSTMSKPSMVRDGDLGYSKDFINTAADRQTIGHAMIAGTYSQPLMNEQVNRVDDAMRAMRESTVIGASEAQKEMAKFHEELKRRVQLLQHIPASPTVDKMRALTAAWYLAMSPAYLVMNAYQPWQVTMPYLGAKYGFMDSAKAMAKNAALSFAIVHKAMKMNWLEEPSESAVRKLDAISSMTLPFADMKDSKGRQLIDNGKLQALEDLQWSGLLSFGLTNQIARVNAEDLGRIAKVTRIASIFSHYVEVTNRLTTMLTAYDLARNPSDWAKQQGTAAMDHEGAVQYARFMVRSTDMDHSQANVARGLGRQGVLGKATPLAVGFQQYDFQMVELLARTISKSFTSNPREAREARRAIAGVSLMTAAMAGTLGLPFVGAFSALANSLASAGGALGLTNDKDDPFDAQQWFRKTAAEMFGKEMGEVISRGLPRAFGLDMSTRSGFQDLIPFTQFFADRAKIADQVTNGALDTLGPAVGTAAGWLEAAHAAYEGDYPRMIQNGLPVGVRNWFKAYWLASHGFEAGGLGHPPIPIGENFTNQANPWQILMQAGGFTPAAKADYTERSQGFNTRQQLLEHRREVITSQIYKAYEAQNWSKLSELWPEMIQFNVTNPLQPITPQSVTAALRGRKEKAAIGAVSGTGILASRQQLPLLQPFNY